jgi:hypothetical protein
MAVLTTYGFPVDFSVLDFRLLFLGTETLATPNAFAINVLGETTEFDGYGFTYDAQGLAVSGTVTEMHDVFMGQPVLDATGFSLPAATLIAWAQSGQTQLTLETGLAVLQLNPEDARRQRASLHVGHAPSIRALPMKDPIARLEEMEAKAALAGGQARLF